MGKMFLSKATQYRRGTGGALMHSSKLGVKVQDMVEF